MTLKELLGENYREDMSLADVEKALEGKNLADLSTGHYVDKGKYDKAQADLKEKASAYDELIANTKDYEELKQFKATTEKEKILNETKGTLKEAGFKDEFIEYGLYLVENGKIAKDDKFLDNARSFLDENKQYGTASQANPVPSTTPNPTNPNVKINTGIHEGQNEVDTLNMPKVVANHSWNK